MPWTDGICFTCYSYSPLRNITHMSSLPEDDDVELGSISSSHVVEPSHALLTDDTRSQTVQAPNQYRLYQWLKGPQPSRPFGIKPTLPRLQHDLLSFFHRKCPSRRQRGLWYALLCLLWAACFLVILSTSIRGCHIPGYRSPVRLSCVSRLW